MSRSITAAGATRHTVIPRWLPLVAAGLLGTLLIVVGSLRLQGFDPVVAPGASVQQRSLQFLDRNDGGVAVFDAGSGEPVAVLHGEQGFLRGVLRGLARERRLHGMGVAKAYALSLHDDGRLTLHDPETGQRIDLASFGHDNAAIFARWLPPANSTGVKQP